MTIDFVSAHIARSRSAALGPPAGESIASLAADEERFNARRESLRRYCFAILRSEADAEDAVQMTLERALRYQGAQVDSERWLLAIARNVCRDLISGTSSSDLSLDDATEMDCRAHADPEQEVVTRDALRGALGSLTPMERRAVGASWVLDRTSYDAARSVGIAHQTLRVHLARARKKLAVYLDEVERASAGWIPWLVNLSHRASRRVSSALSRDAALSDRLLLMTAPPLALAVTIASVAVLGAHSTHSGAAASTGSGPAVSLSLPRADALAHRGAGPAGNSPLSGAGAGVVQTLLPAISPGRQQDAYVSDVEPSPSYAQDHTLFASATDSACGARAACGELFVSHDAGHSWTNLRTIGLQSFAELLLPTGTYADGTFYSFGSGGLQITTDGGRTFTTMVSDLPGYAGLMPPGSPTFVSVANVDLWNFATAAAPGLAGAYPPGTLAAGAALAVPSAAGWTFLQPVEVPGGSEHILVCGGAPACSLGAALPWSDRTTKLTASPDGRVIAALNPAGLAVSRDGGESFQMSTPPQPASDFAVTETQGHVRLVAISRDAGAIDYSDDSGSTWLSARTPAWAGVALRLIRVLTSSQLIIELSRSANASTVVGYACSSDGGRTWSGC